MKNFKKRFFVSLFALIGLIIIGSILFIRNSHSQTGQVIWANSEAVWITNGYTKIDFKNKTEDELAELCKFQGTRFSLPWYIPNGSIVKLTPGQKVKIIYDGIVRLTGPARSGSYWVSTINE